MTTLPLNITFRNLSSKPDITTSIEAHAAKLIALCPRITHIDVVVELPHRHHSLGRHFLVRIVVSVPGRHLVVNRNPDENARKESMDVAVRDAFMAMRRELNSYLASRRNWDDTRETGTGY